MAEEILFEKTPQYAVVSALREKGLTLATAESCTGGLIGKKITDIAGCSSVYMGGAIAYDNRVKEKLLNVGEQTLKQYGAVSEQTALEMCKAIAEAVGADIGLSTTGIAGPGGGTEEKPVGLVYIGIYFKNPQTGETKHKAIKLNLAHRIGPHGRGMVRYMAASRALREVLALFKNEEEKT